MKLLALISGRAAEVDVPLGSGVPTLVASGGTYTTAADTQALYAADIVIDGTVILDGTLVEVY